MPNHPDRLRPLTRGGQYFDGRASFRGIGPKFDKPRPQHPHWILTVNTKKNPQEDHLVKALKSGDRRAFERLVRLHQHLVYALCLRMLCNPQEAEDVAQDVFISLFQSIQSFRQECLLSTWLYRITRNRCLNHIKANRRHGASKEEPLNEETCPATEEGEASQPEQQMAQKEQRALVEEEISRLSEEHRELLLLRDIEQLEYEQIQAITGLPMGTIKSRLHRARMELARRLTPQLTDGKRS